MQLTQKQIDYFWSLVEKSTDPDACWRWLGMLSEKGYGVFGRRPKKYAHRVSYFLHNGSLPPAPLLVCHTCDNPQCANPQHLWVGTNIDNQKDSLLKGRRPHGESHPKANFTESEILHIRQELSNGASGNAIAKRAGVSANAIYAIRDRRSWKHI